jgi:hypothetical protein
MFSRKSVYLYLAILFSLTQLAMLAFHKFSLPTGGGNRTVALVYTFGIVYFFFGAFAGRCMLINAMNDGRFVGGDLVSLQNTHRQGHVLIDNPPVVVARFQYLNVDHPRYSAKLAAAVLAWEAMEDESLLRGRMPKEAMTTWLEENYTGLGIGHKKASKIHGYEAGDINHTAIADIAKLCNWEVDGGAPPTQSTELKRPTQISAAGLI